MAADSTSTGTELVAGRIQRGDSATIERMDEPRAGTYWRLLQAVTGKEGSSQKTEKIVR